MRERDVESCEVEDDAAPSRLLQEEAHDEPLGFWRAMVDHDLGMDGVADAASRHPEPRRGRSKTVLEPSSHAPEMVDHGMLRVLVHRRDAGGERERVAAERAR